MIMAFLNLYKLMNPLALMDTSSFPDSTMVGPLWDESSHMRLKVYLSSRERFHLDFLRSEGQDEADNSTSTTDVTLLLEEDVTTASLAKSFLITTLDCDDDASACQSDASYEYASTWLNDAEHTYEEQVEGGISAMLSSAGEGIESTSVLLSIYLTITKQIGLLFSSTGISPETGSEERIGGSIASDRTVIKLSRKSPLWSALQKNQTLHAHVVLTRNDATSDRTPSSYEDAARSLMRAQKSHSLLLGHASLTKYDLPHHVDPPKRVLYHDIVFLWDCYIFHSDDDSVCSHPPWDMAYSKPDEYKTYQQALQMKTEGAGYPYWKPQVSIKYVNEDVRYPLDLAHVSGMELVQLGGRSASHPTGYAIVPGLHVDEMGLTSEKYIPVNATLTSLPLRLSFDRNDVENEQKGTTATAGGISPARWRLLMHLSKSLESQKELGFEQSDIDDLRRLIADTNVTLLTITMLASALHLLFEFLTFKNEVSFWRKNKDLTGLSVRSLFLDMFSQVIILLYLIEKDSSLLMTVPTGVGCLIAMWKCQRGAGFKFVRVKHTPVGQKIPWWNVLPRIFGHELRATRLEVASHQDKEQDRKTTVDTSKDLTALTIETDKIATRTLGSVLLPVVLTYTAYSFFREEHTGWYSWLITSASSAVYALGFVLMTPQLFLNYKLKSVAHLPWRVLIYKFLNTFIDDLFAFIIRMPTMARISCFRDDIVFIIYLYQRWLYPVDASRPVEGGDGPTTAEDTEKKNK